MKERYHPYWYEEALKSRYKKNLKKTVVLFILFMVFISMEICANKQEISEVKSSRKRNIDMAPEDKKAESKTYFIFNYAYNIISREEIKVKSLSISEDNLIMEIGIDDLEDYGRKINLLENNFEIIEISSAIEEGDSLYFKTRVKINEI